MAHCTAGTVNCLDGGDVTDTPERNKLKSERLATLRRSFVNELPQRLGTIDELWTNVRAGGGIETRDELYRAVHNIAGVCATLGLPALSVRARALEEPLGALRGGEQPPTPEIVHQVAERLPELRAAVKAELAHISHTLSS